MFFFEQTIQGNHKKIISITELPDELVDIYNFEVDETENYYAEGILVHNTSGVFETFNVSQTILDPKWDYNFIKIGLLRDRKELYAVIERRVDSMVNEGLVDEVKRVLKMIENREQINLRRQTSDSRHADARRSITNTITIFFLKRNFSQINIYLA